MTDVDRPIPTPIGVVVGVDSSDGSAVALRWALEQAHLRGEPLTALLAWSYLDELHRAEDGRLVAPCHEADAADVLERALVGALGAAGAVAVERRLVCDHPASALVEASATASLLVVGARGLGRFRSMLLGSVSSACLHHATCPVAVVRAVEQRQSHEQPRIVAAVDGSAASRQALAWAVQQARRSGARLEVVHAWATPVYPAHPLVPATFDGSEFDASARALVEDAIGSVDVRGLVAPPEVVAVQGGAAGSILDVAKGADLVVVGSRGHGGFTGLLLGSVSSQVARHAPCPVVVVPHGRHG
jgi:nucleotide-binding universal stress UspA family protein